MIIIIIIIIIMSEQPSGEAQCGLPALHINCVNTGHTRYPLYTPMGPHEKHIDFVDTL